MDLWFDDWFPRHRSLAPDIRDGVAFTRIAMKYGNANDFRICRLIRAFLHSYSLVPSFIISSIFISLSSIFLLFVCSFNFATASPTTIPPSFDSVNGSPQLDSIAVIRWLTNQIHWSLPLVLRRFLADWTRLRRPGNTIEFGFMDIRKQAKSRNVN